MKHQLAYITVTIIIPVIFILICCLTAYAVNRKRSWCFKLSIWGAFSMILISPVLSFVIGQIALVISNDGWTGLGLLMLSFEITEAISVLAFIIGVVGCLVVKYLNAPKKASSQHTDS